MKLCLLIKYPPIQGGVSAQSYWAARALAERGHEVHVVTHANEVEPAYRLALDDDDRAMLEPRFDERKRVAGGGAPDGSAGGAGVLPRGIDPGRVQLHLTEPMSRHLAHIPQSNPFVSKLAGRATDVIERFGCELIFSYYFEPFGVAGHLAKGWTSVPHVLRHAGSDLGRLMLNPDLAPTYTRIVQRADGVLSSQRHPFAGLGVPASRIHGVPPYFLPAQFFHGGAAPLDMNRTLAALAALSADVVSPGAFDASLPTIGIYGKVGEQKGSFDLVTALAMVKRRGGAFNFVALTAGSQVAAFRQAVIAAGLADRTYVLPFIAHWKVARFIRACTAVCFLERDFTISFHTPSVPREVLACETCLVLSGEILQKQIYRDQLIDGDNFLAVPDPRNVEQLAAVLERIVRDPDSAREVGRRGGKVAFRRISSDELGRAYEAVFEQVVHAARTGEPARRAPPAPAARAADLKALLPQLHVAMGEAFEHHALTYAAETPPPESAGADAEGFVAAVERSGAEVAPDVLAFSRHLLWMGRPVAGEPLARPFGEQLDAVAERGGASELHALAPQRSRLALVVAFERLPEGLVTRQHPAGPPGRCTVLFNKQANLLGHYFVINDWSARLLERCDGTATVSALVERYAADDPQGRPVAVIREIVVGALRSFYRKRIIIFVAPRGQRAG